jgi:hypothetical protein
MFSEDVFNAAVENSANRKALRLWAGAATFRYGNFENNFERLPQMLLP